MKFWRPIIVAAVISPLVIVAVVHAATLTPSTPPAGSTLVQRVALRKQETKFILSPNDKIRLQQNCQTGQTNLRTIEDSTTTMLSNRQQVYNHIDGKLWYVIGQLKIANVDTFKLEKVHNFYLRYVNDFETTGQNYKQTLNDMILIDCQKDPLGFKSLLATARAYYAQLQTKSQTINNYVSNKVQQTINNFANNLQTPTSSNTLNSTNGSPNSTNKSSSGSSSSGSTGGTNATQ